MKKAVLFLALMCLMIAGCASKHMQPVQDTAAVTAEVGPDRAAIVFLRASSMGGGVQAPIVEGENGQVKYVGIVSTGAKIRHLTAPGKHLYTVGGESSGFLEADLEGGKTYYVVVEPKFGAIKSRFALEPVTAATARTEEFKKDFDACEWRESKPEASTWFAENKADMQSKFTDAQKKHTTGKPGDRKIVRPEYGIQPPLR